MTSYAVSMLRRAQTFEPEDSRVSNRLRTALNILAAGGVKPTITHSDRKVLDWATKREVHHCSLAGSGYHDCTIVWEPWVTDDMFDKAYSLASDVVSARGAFHQNAAWAAKRDRLAAAR
jgi:hypothetical protein